MYMSYCRFEGTRQELRACLADVEEHVNGDAEYKVRENEIGHFEQMVREFVDWLNDMALLDEYGELNEREFEQVLDAMANDGGED